MRLSPSLVLLLLAGACAGAEDPPPVEVPAGTFEMGCDPARDPTCDQDEQPAHAVTLSAYAIDAVEVTVEAYATCVDAGVCPPAAWGEADEDPRLPRTGVSGEQAEGYCAWTGRRLPTEAEWERAARGDDAHLYPWGDEPPDCATAALPGCGERIVAVGSHPADRSPFGALDMGGNAAEWVADLYDPDYYAESPATDPSGPATGSLRVLRGLVDWSEADHAELSDREPGIGGAACPVCGFRCAEDR